MAIKKTETTAQVKSATVRAGFELGVLTAFSAVFLVIGSIDTVIADWGVGLLGLTAIAGVSMWLIHFVARGVRRRFGNRMEVME